MRPLTYTPIGVVHTPFTAQAGMPLQTVAARGVAGTIELAADYLEGLNDLSGFSHLWLLVHLHQVRGHGLTVTPYLDDQPRGVFATRSPRRPNPIGLSIVRLLGVDGATLSIEEVDLLDGTPVLDIKPYVPLFDDRANALVGWFASRQHDVYEVRADDRFR